MAGLSFFYHGTGQSNLGKFPEDYCIEETEVLTYDLIINLNCLSDDGVYDLFVNGGITMLYFMVFVMLCNEWNWIQPVKKWIPDSVILLTIGLIIGFSFRYAQSKESLRKWYTMGAANITNTINLLTFLFKPIVLLNVGYELYHVKFFRQFWDIVLLSVVGTFINMCGVALCLKAIEFTGINVSTSLLHYFVFSTALAAIDPVSVLPVFEDINKNAYFLLFGECTLNNGATYTLFASLEKMMEYGFEGEMDNEYPAETILYLLLSIITDQIFAGFLAVVMIGFSSLISQMAGTQNEDFVPYVVTGFMWWGYYMADTLGFSSITYIVICALGQKRYTFPNISYSNRRTIVGMIKTAATVMESAIFVSIGIEMGARLDDTVKWYIPYALIVLIFVLIFRAISVFGFFAIVNFQRSKERQILMKWQVIIFLGGGIRGAFAYLMGLKAYMLSQDKPNPLDAFHRSLFFRSLLFIITVTVFINGLIIKPLIQKFKLEKKTSNVENLNEIVKILSCRTGEVLDEITTGSGFVSSNRLGKFSLCLAALDNKVKEWLIKDVRRNRKERRILKERENPTEFSQIV